MTVEVGVGGGPAALRGGGGGRRAGRRSCGITPISVIRSSAVAGRRGEMAIQGALEGLSSTPDGRYQPLGKISPKKLLRKIGAYKKALFIYYFSGEKNNSTCTRRGSEIIS